MCTGTRYAHHKPWFLLYPYDLGSEVYVGCTNGELIRYALQPEPDSTKVSPVERVPTASCHVALCPQQESYSLLSRQSLPNGKPIDELVLIPYMSRMLILSGKRTLLSHWTPLIINSKIAKSTFILYLRSILCPISSPFGM